MFESFQEVDIPLSSVKIPLLRRLLAVTSYVIVRDRLINHFLGENDDEIRLCSLANK